MSEKVFVVSRFEQIDNKLVPTQDIGSPHGTREEAELKLAQTRKAFESGPRYHFDIRELPAKPHPEPLPLVAESETRVYADHTSHGTAADQFVDRSWGW